MKILDLKEHNKKISDQTKRVLKGTYPTAKIARTGSYIGMAIGILLSLIGGIGFFFGNMWGIGSMFAGVITIISNTFHLNRIK